MGWVRQRQPNDNHICNLPHNKPKDSTVYIPSFFPAGSFNDLWRCDDCRKLWRVGLACDYCDYFGKEPHMGSHLVGLKWRECSWLQQLFYRNR